MTRRPDLRILVLGGYGFIGHEITRRLLAAGHDVLVIGRDTEIARRLLPDVACIAVNLAEPVAEVVWHTHLEGIDAVVNVAGALQTSRRDDVEAVHHSSIAGLIRACETHNVRQFVQISAVGSSPDAATEFMRSKARGDSCVRSSELDWILIRPGLVIGPNAYGGTALIRMLASVPLVQPIAFGNAPIQTVAVDDLAHIVLDALEGRLPGRIEFDLVEDHPVALRAVIHQFRRWLGAGPARMDLEVPAPVLSGVAKLADILAYLGWRPPLRTTTLKVLQQGVLGNPDTYRRIGSRRLSSLSQTLEAMPSTLQERWFGRLYLAMPVAVSVLALFWILTGVIALMRLEESAALTGLSPVTGRLAVTAGAVIDMGLGAAVLYRRSSKVACWAMTAVATIYIVIGSAVRPDLWMDPLGPLLKVFPVLMLSVIAGLLLDDR